MASTSTLRVWYAPPCVSKWNFREAYEALNSCFRVHNYAPEKGHTGAQNCRRITGGSGYSLHAYFGQGMFSFWSGVRIAMALATDINWRRNPYGPRLVTDMPRAMIDDVYKVRTNSGARVWGWGGYYRKNKDAMHFEIVCSPADLNTGIDPATLPGKSKKEGFLMALNDKQQEELLANAAGTRFLIDIIYQALFPEGARSFTKVPGTGLNYGKPTIVPDISRWSAEAVEDTRQLVGMVAGLAEAIVQMQGGDVDLDGIRKAASEGAQAGASGVAADVEKALGKALSVEDLAKVLDAGASSLRP